MAVKKDSIGEMLTSYWNGERPLWVIFWVWGYGIGGLLVASMTYMLAHAKENWPALEAKVAELAIPGSDMVISTLKMLDYGLFSVFAFGAAIWWFVSVWRCAANSTKLWEALTRALIAVSVIGTVAYMALYIMECLSKGTAV